jgi:hypothetical protein
MAQQEKDGDRTIGADERSIEASKQAAAPAGGQGTGGRRPDQEGLEDDDDVPRLLVQRPGLEAAPVGGPAKKDG